jgi:alpha-N-arabinofuranosidase
MKDKRLNVTITNASLDSAIRADIRLTNGSVTEGRGSVLTHADMAARNTFERLNEVEISQLQVTVRSDRTEISLPPRSVVALELKMA